MDTIDNQQWFLGKMTGEAAVTILMASAETNTFVVYRDKDRDVLMFAMRHTCLNAHRVGSNTSTDKVSHLEIQCQDGRYSVTGQMEFFTDAVRAVNTFAATHDPRLCSALSLESLITNSITVAPPPYSQAQRALKPDVAPLPRIPDLQREGENYTLRWNRPTVAPSVTFRFIHIGLIGPITCCTASSRVSARAT
ncbi:hypothetical protein EMCRGX_G009920 [Ephydatia muelleri]